MTPPPKTDETLLPCPWCSHTAFVVVQEVPNENHGGTWWRTGCKGCGVSFPLNFQRDAAIKEWNDRMPTAPVSDEMVEAALKANYRDIDWEYGTIETTLQACRHDVVRGWVRAMLKVALSSAAKSAPVSDTVIESLRNLHNMCKRKAKEYELHGMSEPAGTLLGVCMVLRDIAGVEQTEHRPSAKG